MSESYAELLAHLRETANLGSMIALLSWDQETMMPAGGAESRAEQLGLAARLAHERATSPRMAELLAACEANGELCSDSRIAANLREMRRDYDRSVKLPSALVAEISETSSRALEAWRSARRDDDFDSLRPWLGKQFDLARRKAECYGTPEGGEAYDALLQDYEPGMTGTELERIFGPLRPELSRLIAEIGAAGHPPDLSPGECEFAVEKQKRFNEVVLERLGFDTTGGRLDISTHPFSTGIGPGDTRITTRYSRTDFIDALGSTMHEAGHAMYEQGLPRREHNGQPLGESLSLGIHESQSRTWENHVGRSRPFWEWALPVARQELGDALAPFSADDLYEAANAVRPGLIRVESDEATYNLHVMLRFDLERSMIRGDLKVGDLPEAWNARMKQDLGLDVPNDSQGCMQDIHWAMGSVGYFPTYTLGNLYAAQFWGAARAALPDLDRGMAAGDFSPLLDWLRTEIHAHGRRFTVEELCLRVSGAPLSHEPLVAHLDDKLRPIYRLAPAKAG